MYIAFVTVYNVWVLECVCVSHTFICCEEQAHTMMEAEKSCDLPSVSRGPRKDGGMTQSASESKGLSANESNSTNPSKGWRQCDEWSLLKQWEGTKRSRSSFLYLLFYSGSQQFGWCQFISKRAIYFTGSTSSNANPSRNTLKDILRSDVWSGHSMASQVDL